MYAHACVLAVTCFHQAARMSGTQSRLCRVIVILLFEHFDVNKIAKILVSREVTWFLNDCNELL